MEYLEKGEIDEKQEKDELKEKKVIEKENIKGSFARTLAFRDSSFRLRSVISAT